MHTRIQSRTPRNILAAALALTAAALLSGCHSSYYRVSYGSYGSHYRHHDHHHGWSKHRYSYGHHGHHGYHGHHGHGGYCGGKCR